MQPQPAQYPRWLFRTQYSVDQEFNQTSSKHARATASEESAMKPSAANWWLRRLSAVDCGKSEGLSGGIAYIS